MLKIFYIDLSDNLFTASQEKSSGISLESRLHPKMPVYKNPVVSRNKRVGEAVTAYVACRFIGKSEEGYTLVRNEYGKPYFRDYPHFFFNISHSGDFLVYAFSDTEVGVDIERVNTARMAVAARFFHPVETRLLEQAAPEERDRLFFRYWSVKESFLKYTGKGLSRPLSSFRVELTDRGAAIYEDSKRLPLFVRECPVAAGYMSYVCSRQPDIPEIVPLFYRDLKAYL